ncbi:hypothetical protein FACS1894200_00620 [Spirochaetia bacterium]|nr:hypothetical protein FACS1894200_00620 [Spirochaetia bacterium]
MKRLVFLSLALGLSVSLFAQTGGLQIKPQYAAGNWTEVNGRYVQNDARARLAKANLRIPQSGIVEYEFNVRYEDGLGDGHGGFGIHIFGDTVAERASWGSGNSYLLWLNYDTTNPQAPGVRNGNPKNLPIPKGLSAQVYRSFSDTYMELLESKDLNDEFSNVTWDVLNYPIHFKIQVNGNTGEVRVFDPTDPDLIDYYSFYIDRKSLPLRGNWVSVRTNGIKLSFQPTGF